MKYKKLTSYLEDEEKDTAIFPIKQTSNHGNKIPKRYFLKGIKVQDKFDYINILIDPDPEITWFKKWKDHMYIHGIGHLFSLKAINILEELKQEHSLEYFPVKLLNEQNVDISPFPYFVINIYNALECIDQEKSQFNEVGLGVTLISKLVLENNKIPKDVSFFNLKKFPNYIFFSDDLIELFKKENISGCVWKNIEDIRK